MLDQIVALSEPTMCIELLLALPFCVLQSDDPSPREIFAVVVNSDNPTADLSVAELRRVFRTDRRFWPSNTPIDLLLPRSGTTAKRVLLERVFEMDDLELKRHWTELVYRHELVEEPRTIPSSKAALSVVGRMKGAVAVIPVGDVPLDGSVRTLLLIGLRPGDDEYPLWLEVVPKPVEASARDFARALEAATFDQAESRTADQTDVEFADDRPVSFMGWDGEGWPPVRFLFFGHAEFEYERVVLDGISEKNSGFSVESLDVLTTAAIDERTSVLVETVLDAEDEGGFEVELARLLLKHRFSDLFSVEAGRFLTGLGHWNSRYHHGEWIQTSIDRPAVLDFEDEGGLLPIHSVGLSFKGAYFGSAAALDYTLELTNGRGPVAGTAQVKGDANLARAVNASFGVAPTSVPGLRFGAGGYWDMIPENSDSDLGPLHGKIDEVIVNAYCAYVYDGWELMGEYFATEHSSASAETESYGWYAQVGRRFGRLTPYIRLDGATRDDAEEYLPTTEDTSTWAIGLRYDAFQSAALTVQYEDTNGDAAPGVEEGEDTQTLVIQLSFAF